ncbi:MAG: DUF512 domain-containing protein [Bacillota bacterium]
MKGGVLATVYPGSLAEEVGLRAGDVIISVNGVRLRDVIDFMYQMSSDSVELRVLTSSGRQKTLKLSKGLDQGLGVRFAQDVFDGVKLCTNRCDFCFVAQLPPGLRASLSLRDDDYRLSFLHGNFITMTNMSSEDFKRVARYHLSPLYVSVHTTNPGVRAKMLRNSRARLINQQLEWLAANGIRFHCQIVLVPGLNAGNELARTIEGLKALRPWAKSVGVVPVGLTKYHRFGLRRLSPAEAVEVLDIVEQYHRSAREEGGYGWVYAADELYLSCGRAVPKVEYYDDFPQLENGIGIVASFLESVATATKRLGELGGKLPRATVVCGTLCAEVVGNALRKLSEAASTQLELLPVENGLFGESVNVSGLLAGRDIAKAVKDRPGLELLVVPRQAAPEGVFIDDVTLGDLARVLGVRVVTAGPEAGDLVEVLAKECGEEAKRS